MVQIFISKCTTCYGWQQKERMQEINTRSELLERECIKVTRNGRKYECEPKWEKNKNKKEQEETLQR